VTTYGSIARALAFFALAATALYALLLRGLPLLGYDPQAVAQAVPWFVGAALVAVGMAAVGLELWLTWPVTGRRDNVEEA
jgi:hypothetical protein